MKKIFFLFLLFPLFSFAQIDSFNIVFSNPFGLNQAKFTKKVSPQGNINLIERTSVRTTFNGLEKLVTDTYEYDQADRLIFYRDMVYWFTTDLLFPKQELSISYDTTTLRESKHIGNPLEAPSFLKTEIFPPQTTLPYLYSTTSSKYFDPDWVPKYETFLELDDGSTKIYRTYPLAAGSSNTKTEYIFEGKEMTRNIDYANADEDKNRVSIILNTAFQMPELIEQENCDVDTCKITALTIGAYDSNTNTGYLLRKDLTNAFPFTDSTAIEFNALKAITKSSNFFWNDNNEIQKRSETHYTYNADNLLDTIFNYDESKDTLIASFYYVYDGSLVNEVKNLTLTGVQLKYPNPTTPDQFIQIEVEDAQRKYQLQVSDASGKRISQMPLQGNQSIPCSNLNMNSGIYYLTLESDQKIKTWKIILF